VCWLVMLESLGSAKLLKFKVLKISTPNSALPLNDRLLLNSEKSIAQHLRRR
jgi:hypothetical protein